MTEHKEQVALMHLVKLHAARWPELGLLYAVPNGGKRNRMVAIKLKAEGLKPGVPDICLPVARGEHHGLYIELKRQDGGKRSKEQKAWILALKGQGYRAEFCSGAVAAWDTIKEYLTTPDRGQLGTR